MNSRRNCTKCGDTFTSTSNRIRCLKCNKVTRPCAQCGDTFTGRDSKCSRCRRTPTVCAVCTRTFSGTGNKVCGTCYAKRDTKPPCDQCGKAHNSNALSCDACRHVPATASCRRCGRNTGAAYAKLCSACKARPLHTHCVRCDRPLNLRVARGNVTAGRLCSRCQTVERQCTECGQLFRHVGAIRCNPCRTKRRECKTCHRVFTSAGAIRCARCRALARVCKCGKHFTSTSRSCPTCSSRQRHTCTKCGNTTSDNHTLCNTCRYAATSAAGRAGYAQRTAQRRVTRIQASTDGTIPKDEYARIRALPCVYCGAEHEHVDHVRPLARDGSHTVGNLVSACRPCNSSKNDRLLTEWDTVRVHHGIAHSEKVAAEWHRLTTIDAS